MNNPNCPRCGFVFPWRDVLTQVLGRTRRRGPMWGAVCAQCDAALRVPMSRVLLIFASGIFFGSQTSTLLVLKDLTATEMWLARLWLIVGFYAIAVFVLLRLEIVE